jgi:hypothetical protein
MGLDIRLDVAKPDCAAPFVVITIAGPCDSTSWALACITTMKRIVDILVAGLMDEFPLDPLPLRVLTVRGLLPSLGLAPLPAWLPRAQPRSSTSSGECSTRLGGALARSKAKC